MLQIDRLTLRVPGHDKDNAHKLGREVADYVASNLPNRYMDQRLGAVKLRVSMPSGTERSKAAGLIAEAILRSLI